MPMIRTENPHLQTAALSHPGMTGKNNEDRFAVSAYRTSTDNPTPSLLAVLCDGIGGHRAGEVAAEVAVNTISQVVAESDATQPMEVLQKAIVAANQRIYEQAQQNSDLRGMGSTCACAWVIGNRLFIVSVGDSRVYLQRGDAIYQLTTDHTFVQELLEKGVITQEQVHNHPNAHVIRRYLGAVTPPAGDFRLRLGAAVSDELALANQGMVLRPGDRLLLCSDGLTDLVTDTEIRSTLDSHLLANPDRVARRPAPGKAAKDGHRPPDAPNQQLTGAIQDLVDLANQRGGHDNITVIVMQAPDQPKVALKQSWFSKKWRVALVGCLGLAVIVLFAGIIFFGLSWQQGRIRATTDAQTPLPDVTSVVPGGNLLTGTPGFAAQTLTAAPTTILFTTDTPTPGARQGPSLTPWPTNTLPSSGLSSSNH